MSLDALVVVAPIKTIGLHTTRNIAKDVKDNKDLTD